MNSLWKLWKAGSATFPQFPQHDNDVLPMSLEDSVTYVPGLYRSATKISNQCSAAAVRISDGDVATSGSFNGRGSR